MSNFWGAHQIESLWAHEEAPYASDCIIACFKAWLPRSPARKPVWWLSCSLTVAQHPEHATADCCLSTQNFGRYVILSANLYIITFIYSYVAIPLWVLPVWKTFPTFVLSSGYAVRHYILWKCFFASPLLKMWWFSNRMDETEQHSLRVDLWG